MELVAGIVYVCLHPSQGAAAFFGDYYLSLIAALAYLGPAAGFAVGLVLVLRTGSLRVKRIVIPMVLLAVSWLLYMESSAFELNRAIGSAYKSLESGQSFSRPARLTTDRAKSVIARLSRPGQQFSSHGSLYAVGPVDVFGPWTYIQRGRLHPVEWLHQTKWPRYMRLHEATWPIERPEPIAWRGLSPRETRTPCADRTWDE